MSYAALSLSQTPPLAVPLRYILTAPLFAAAAGLVLILFPESLVSRWAPTTLAATHLLTLGFLAMTMFGALQQLLPVLTGAQIPRASAVSVVVHAGLTLGSAALATGMATSSVLLLQAGTSLLVVTVTLFAATSGVALLRARSAHSTVWAMAGALVSLLVTVSLGTWLLAYFGWHVPLASPLTSFHLMWGLTGWVAVLIIGVAWQVVPMFQLTPDYPRLLLRFLVPVLLGGLALWSVAHMTSFSTDAPLLLVILALLTFAVATLWLQRRRRRRLPDVTLSFWRVAMVTLIAALLLMLVPGERSLMIGVLLIIGFAMSAVNGMLYKIVPFLVWLHLNNHLQQSGRQAHAPNMKRIIADVAMKRHYRLHLLMLGLLLLAVVWPAVLARAAGGALALSSLLLGWNLMQGALVYRRVLRSGAQ